VLLSFPLEPLSAAPATPSIPHNVNTTTDDQRLFCPANINILVTLKVADAMP
jgi:hypothetical protein